MFAFVSGDWPVLRPRAVVLCAALVLVPALSGCGSNSQANHAMNGPAVMSWRLFDEPQAPRPVQVVQDLEDDGLAAQTPPPKSIRNQIDDPSQPWSPNYGRIRPGTVASGLAEGTPSSPLTQSQGKPHMPDQVASQETE
jgi:hypothetical protein